MHYPQPSESDQLSLLRKKHFRVYSVICTTKSIKCVLRCLKICELNYTLRNKETEKYERVACIALRNEAYVNSLLRSYSKKNEQTKKTKINKKQQQQQKHKQGIARRASDSRIDSTFFLTPDSPNQVTHGTWSCEGWGGGVNDSCAKRRRTARQIEELMATEKTLRSGPQNY